MSTTSVWRVSGMAVLVGVLLFQGRGTPAAPADAPQTKKPRVNWKSMFDGKKLTGWQIISGKVIKEAEYEDHGEVRVEDKCLVLEKGVPATGIRWTGKFPKSNYELALDAMRADGNDFFCGLSFPAGDGALTLVLGGWGGAITGLSCIDNMRAVDNETATFVELENERWYRVRVRVTDPKVEVWLDDKRIIDFERTGRELSVTFEMEPCLPLGVATWYTTGKLRNIRYRTLVDGDKPPADDVKRQSR